VQRVDFVTPQVTPALRRNAATASPRPAPSPTPNAELAPPVRGDTTLTTSSTSGTSGTSATVQRLPSQDGKQVSNSPSRPSLAVSRRETQLMQPGADVMVQRLESYQPEISTPAAVTERALRSANRSESTSPDTRSVGVDLPIQRTVAVPTESSATEMPVPAAVQDAPMGPAVLPEPWIPNTQQTRSSQATAPGPAVPAGPTLIPTISRLAAEMPQYPALRSAGSSATLAVGPSIPRVGSNASSIQAQPSAAMSFASMFASSHDSETGSSAENGFTSVQLQSADEPAPPAAEPTAGTSSAAPAGSESAPPPPAGAKPPDLDELARRLYEPLTARLRAELWLDRERAGVTGDV
jgi:hypothetical protein